MSSRVKDIDSVDEGVKKKVNKMYQNYGIDPENSDDSDLSRVYRHYKSNPKQLESDYQKSKKHADLFSEEDTL